MSLKKTRRYSFTTLSEAEKDVKESGSAPNSNGKKRKRPKTEEHCMLSPPPKKKFAPEEMLNKS